MPLVRQAQDAEANDPKSDDVSEANVPIDIGFTTTNMAKPLG